MEPQAPTSAPEPSQPMLPPIPPQRTNKRTLIITGIALVIVAGVVTIYVLSAKPSNNAATQTKTNTTTASEPQAKAEQMLTNPVDSSKVTIEQSDYYGLAVGNTTYYGPILKINATYVRMIPTAYKSQGKLIFTGDELHGPESATFFTVSSVSSIRKLEASSADDAVIINFVKPDITQASYAYPSEKIDEYIETSHLQSFVFKDGMMLFAKALNLQGNFLSSAKHVYYMAGSNGQVSLTVAKPEQYNTRTSNDLLYWQNLKSDSRVAKAIADYEKHTP